jgi:factor associated with neutral sphingomyelinase activation
MYSVSQDSSLKIYNLTEGKQMRSMQIGQLALSSSAVTADGKCILIGSWDNNVYTYSIDYGRVQDVLNAHDDSVSCLALGNSTLISGSWDSTVKAWTLRPTGIERAPIASWASLDTEVRSVALDNSGNMVVAGATDGMVMLADLRTKQCVRTWHPHDDEVVSLRWTGDGRIVSAAKDGHLKVENQTGHELLAIQLADSLRCFATNGERLLLGGESGLLRVWDVLGGEEITQLSKKTQSPINCIATSADGTLVLTGSDDGSITKWTR